MFTNLIESSADKAAFKRRSSFFLVTVASYALFLFAAGVVGVLTFDAQVEAQTTDLLVELAIPPVDRAPQPEPPRDSPIRRPRTATAPVDRNVTQSERTAGVTATNDPTRVPEKVGTTASNVPPVTGSYRIGPRNLDPPSSVIPGTPGCVICGSGPPTVAETVTPPLPPATTKPSTLRVSAPVILAKVVDLPKPLYPTIAKQARIQGPVNVQILVDESGRVISAQAVKGSPMLTQAAVNAALRARFTPTKLGDQPVKVQGVITYNFVLQQ